MITPSLVRDRATRAHLPLASLLDMAGIERSTFWRWERGIGKPHPVTLQKISDALDQAEQARAS